MAVTGKRWSTPGGRASTQALLRRAPITGPEPGAGTPGQDGPGKSSYPAPLAAAQLHRLGDEQDDRHHEVAAEQQHAQLRPW